MLELLEENNGDGVSEEIREAIYDVFSVSFALLDTNELEKLQNYYSKNSFHPKYRDSLEVLFKDILVWHLLYLEEVDLLGNNLK